MLAKNTYLKREYRIESPSKMAQDLGVSIELKRLKDNKAVDEKNKVVYNSVKEAYKSVNLRGIEPEFKNKIENAFKELAEEYPIDTKTIALTTSKGMGAFGWSRGQISGRSRKGEKVAVFESKINLSNILHETQDSSIKYHKGEYDKRGSKLVDDGTGLTSIYHEFAHQIDDWFLLQNKPDLQEIKNKWSTPKPYNNIDVKEINYFNLTMDISPDKLSKKIFKKMKDKYGISKFNALVKENYGSYAASKEAEFFAEAFTNMKLLTKESKTDFMLEFEKTFRSLMGTIKKEG